MRKLGLVYSLNDNPRLWKRQRNELLVNLDCFNLAEICECGGEESGTL